jgi:DNA-binding transcriptional LysR family regulator
MDLLQLETFVSVAEERSFSRAALKLHRTQPAVSQAIARLEAELGETLLDRSVRDGSLTDAGTVLLEYAEKMLNLRKDATAAIGDLRRMQKGRLTVAANEYTSLYLLPVMAAFRRENPKVSVSVQRALASRIAGEVLQHSVEFGVLSFRPSDRQVRSIVVYRDELVCIVAPKHALAKSKRASLERLGREFFVAHNVPSPMRQKVIEAFARHKAPLNMEVELPSLEGIKRFIELGDGIALVPRLAVEPELKAGTLVGIAVPELHMERKLRLVYRRQAPLSHAGRAFLAVVQRQAKEHGGRFTFTAEN